jgi:hypothetical protein
VATFTLSGTVVAATNLQPIAGAVVALIAPASALRSVPGITLLPPGIVSWTRVLSGFAGSRWDCWTKNVDGTVPGLAWAQFRDDSLIYNPHLNDDGRIYKPEKSYLLPERTPDISIVWTKPLTGFSGSRWDCWTQHVQGRVPMTWDEFMNRVLELNPQLSADGRVFKPEKSYLLPDVVGEARAKITVTTGPDGRWTMAGLPEGVQGVLEAFASGYGRASQPIVVNGNRTIPIQLAGGSSMHSDLPNFASLPPVARTLIEQALALLGDDRTVYDSLQPRFQQMCHGAKLSDPNDFHYKDIVCADACSISLVAAGLDIGSLTTSSLANHYKPGTNARFVEVSDPSDWLPGDVLCYWNGDLATARLGHVNIYVGSFSGVDRSGKRYEPSAANDVVEASMNFTMSGNPVGLGVIGCTKASCLSGKRGFQNVKRVRHVDVARAFGK